MAKRYSRRRTVRGKPNYVWITTNGIGSLESTFAGSRTIFDTILIPSDWQTVAGTAQSCTLVHTVYTHAMYGTSITATNSWCGLYAIVKTNDQNPLTSPPNLGKSVNFTSFFDEYDECLHWGQFTAMPFDALSFASGLWVGGGSMAAMPENMLNLNARRVLKGDDSIKVIWSSPDVNLDDWRVTWFARSLVRIGLK